MLIQFISFCFISLSSILIGAVIKKQANWHISFSHDFLIGFASTNALFTAISIFHPIDDRIISLYISILITYALLAHKWLRQYSYAIINTLMVNFRDQPIFVSFSILFIVISFFQSLYPPSLHYDAGLYHVQAIKWISEYPTIRGLVNLNIFFGYNFNIFALYAASSFQTLFNQPVYSINFTLISFFTLWVFSKITGAIKSGHYLLANSFILIFYSLIINFLPHISTPSNDTAVFILLIIILLSATDLNKGNDSCYSVIILSVYAATVKLSAGPILLLALYMFSRKYFWLNKKQVFITIVLSGLIAIPWIVKNSMITGWLIFPFPYIDLFSFDWKIPLTDVIALKEGIKNFYIPTENTTNEIWIKEWLFNQAKLDLLIILLVVITLALLLYKTVTKKIFITQYRSVLIIVSILGILYMFLNSPSLRYCIAFFLAVITLSIKEINVKSRINTYGFYLSTLLIACVFLKDNWFHPWHFIKNIEDRYLLPYPIKSSALNRFSYILIDNTIKCYYPLGSDQCFDHCLPCASNPVAHLHLRGNTIEQGFYIGLKKQLE